MLSTVKKVNEVMSKFFDETKIDKNISKSMSGYEGLDDFAITLVKNNVADLNMNITTAFEDLSIDDSDNFSIEPYQVEIAKKAAITAINPLDTLNNVKNAKSPVVAAGMESFNLGTPDYSGVEAINSGFEAFDGVAVTPKVKFNIIYSALAAKQDVGAEYLFPIIPFDGNSSGISLTVRVTSIINEFNRSADGLPNAKQMGMVPLIKVVNNPEIIDVNRNRLVPVYRATGEAVNSSLFVSNVNTEVKNINGEKISTRPLKVGVEVNMLGISQSEAMLAKGSMNLTDALDPRVKLNKLYFNMTTGTTTEPFAFNIEALNTTFTYSPIEHEKDLLLSTSVKSLVVLIDRTKTFTANGTESAVLTALPHGYSIKLDVKLSGEGNTQSGDVVVYANAVKLVSILDAAGREVPATEATYIAINEVFNTLAITGYESEAYLTNSNARMNGLLITSNAYTVIYTVPLGTGFSTILPVVQNGDNGDLSLLGSSITTGRWKINMAAYKTLFNFISYMRNSAPDAEIGGLANKLVNRAFIDETVDLSTIVDGIKSTERMGDIRSALLAKIRVAAISLYTGSNYNIALEQATDNSKATVIIVTDTLTGAILNYGEGIPSDSMFNYKIAATNNSLMKGKLVFTFGIFDSSRNKEPNILNFGHCAYGPDLIIPVSKTVNNSSAIYTTTMTRFLHTIHLPIMGVYSITGVESVIGKIATYRHDV